MKRPAFSLLEIIIALGIFGILSVTVIAVFLSSGREERRGIQQQEGVASARFIFESMARDVRLGSVNYGAYTSVPLRDGAGLKPVDRLALRLADGTFFYYRCIATQVQFNSVIIQNTAEQPCGSILSAGLTLHNRQIQTSTDTVSWTPLSIEGVDITSFKVFIEPAGEPTNTAAAEADRLQPRVTMALTVVGINPNEQQTPTLIQTTVTSRRYVPAP